MQVFCLKFVGLVRLTYMNIWVYINFVRNLRFLDGTSLFASGKDHPSWLVGLYYRRSNEGSSKGKRPGAEAPGPHMRLWDLMSHCA